MSEPPDPGQEVVEWLCTLRLSQYVAHFLQGGYRALDDCRDLTDEGLLELDVLPTGHRRRILRSLEALGVKPPSGEEEDDDDEDEEEGAENGRRRRRKPVPFPRNIYLQDKKRGMSCQHHQAKEKVGYNPEGSRTLPPGARLGSTTEDRPLVPPQPAPRDPQNIQTSGSTNTATYIPPSVSSSSSTESLGITEIPPDWEVSPEEQVLSSSDSVPGSSGTGREGGFSGEMVENSIYETQAQVRCSVGQRLTRSYKLRHRPVPEIPVHTIPPLQERIAPPEPATSPEPLTASEDPSGANGTQRAVPQKTLTPIAPYGETFLYNSPENPPEQGPKEVPTLGFKDKIKAKKLRKKLPKQKESKEKPEPSPAPVAPVDACEEAYSTVEECSRILPHDTSEQTLATPPDIPPTADSAAGPQDGSLVMVTCDLYSEAGDALGAAGRSAMADISPYACFYGAPEHQVLKVGWLDKLSPQGNCVFQRRWVRFDGESLAYYNNDKEMYSKGMITTSGIKQVRGLGDNKFEVVTSLRTFTFRAEREVERQEWMEILQSAAPPPASTSSSSTSSTSTSPSPADSLHQPPRSSSSSSSSSVSKRGLLELRGYKSKVLVSLHGSKVRLCKSEQDHRAGLAITEVELTAANIRDVDRRGFEINTPFKNFCFGADAEWEKEEWMESIQESIAETLSDYEVAEKVWFDEANRSCADCRAPRPEWASVNLGVVICKKCAGQHRSLGPSISKVRSLKLDSSIWSNELVELFLEVGNKNANSFWAANLPPEEELYSGASLEQRATFVRRKYRERKYRKVLEGFSDLEELNKALCAAVVSPDVLRTMTLVFSGADVMCPTGDPAHSTPYMLAQRAGQKLQMEFLHQNKLSDFPRLEQWSEDPSVSDVSLFMDGFLYISASPAKSALDRRRRDDMARRWCTLEGGFLSYYESERSSAAIGRVEVGAVVSLAVSNTETMTGAGAVFTMELYLQTERVLTVGAETQETQHDWIQAVTKCFVPPTVDFLVQRESELIGRLHYKEGHDLYHWRLGWFMLEGSVLHFSPGGEEPEEEVLQLRQLQELTVSTHTEGEDKIQVLLMVEGRRTVYIHGFNRTDFALWHSAIALAAGTNGTGFSDQQLTKNGVPIIVDSCLAFVTQYGLCQEGIYERVGDPGRRDLLLQEFTHDARNVKLREKEQQLEEVTDTLKSFLSQTDDALLTKERYPYWVSALDDEDEERRVRKYSTFIDSLPKVNKSTLEALLQHLYRVHLCSHLNHMPSEKLALVFSSCLFQTRGQTTQEINVIRDLINNYITLFNVNEEQVQQMERENSFITRWNDKKDTTFSPAGDLIFEVYLEKRGPENCCLIKISPSMRSSELAETALTSRNSAFDANHFWTTFEVIENGELERPLHHSEKILEQVLEWSALESPGAAFLVIKKFAAAKRDADGKADQKQFVRGEHLKFSDGSSKLLSGHKFQDKYVALRGGKLLLYRDIKSVKAEKMVQLESVKCYLGLRKKLKPPTSWGITVYSDKQQWHLCCESREAQVSWATDIIRMKFGSDLCSKSMKSKEAADQNPTRGGAVADGGALPNDNKDTRKQFLTRRQISAGVTTTTTRAPTDDTGLHKSTTFPKLQTLHLPLTRRSVDLSHPPRPHPSPSPSPSRLPSRAGFLPRSPQSVHKPTNQAGGKKPPPTLGGHGAMPPNLLNELNSVLTKTGRGAKNSD